jgi:hypothetical protein
VPVDQPSWYPFVADGVRLRWAHRTDAIAQRVKHLLQGMRIEGQEARRLRSKKATLVVSAIQDAIDQLDFVVA